MSIYELYYIHHYFILLCSQKNLGHFCLHVEAIRKVKNAKFNVLPEYACLVLSPANFWQQDIQVFLRDTNIIGTVFNYQVILILHFCDIR